MLCSCTALPLAVHRTTAAVHTSLCHGLTNGRTANIDGSRADVPPASVHGFGTATVLPTTPSCTRGSIFAGIATPKTRRSIRRPYLAWWNGGPAAPLSPPTTRGHGVRPAAHVIIASATARARARTATGQPTAAALEWHRGEGRRWEEGISAVAVWIVPRYGHRGEPHRRARRDGGDECPEKEPDKGAGRSKGQEASAAISSPKGEVGELCLLRCSEYTAVAGRQTWCVFLRPLFLWVIVHAVRARTRLPSLSLSWWSTTWVLRKSANPLSSPQVPDSATRAAFGG